MDPGLGFAKNARQSAALLARLDEIVRAVDVRKSFGDHVVLDGIEL